jgi:anti-anti-sigma regulatory factor
MEVHFDHAGAVLVIAVAGRLDTASVPEFDHLIAPDMVGLGGRLRLCAIAPRVMEFIEIRGFPALLDIDTDRASALEAA